MEKNINKIPQIHNDLLNNSNVFIELYSPEWKNANKISLNDLLKSVKSEKVNLDRDLDIEKHIDKKTIVIDPKTLKIKVDDSLINLSNVQHNFLENNSVIPALHPPKNATEKTTLKIMSDQNYLYVWVGNRWKRILLSEW